MLKRVAISYCVALVFGMALFVSAQFINGTITKGDVNGDDRINILDALCAVNIILDEPCQEPPSIEDQICAADVNGDGDVNVVDVILIVNEILYPNTDWFVTSCDEVDCNDGNSCTQDNCDSLCVQCKHINVSSGTPCDDGDTCTENDQCVKGKCVGTPKYCDDGDPCTDDFCDPLSGECDSTPINCDDGNPCTDDSCNLVTGECEHTNNTVPCDDGDPCTEDACNPLTGECGYTYNSVPCDDADPCTENDVCLNGICQGTTKDCDDGDPCTDDSCNPSSGECEYTYNSLPCDDGDLCTENDICQNGICQGTLKNCNDGNLCTDDICNPSTGECEYTYNTSPCDDGDPCTENDVCQNGVCQGTLIAMECGTVTDIDGNVYQTVQIGCQCWMAENLKVTHYRNGDPIPNVTGTWEWNGLTTGAYCNYNNDINNVAIYGRLYNSYAVRDGRNIAPEGWHVPTVDEWDTLTEYLDGWSIAGGKMKTTGTIEGGDGLWYAPNTDATNESGFSGLPGGWRPDLFGNLGRYGYFWSSTERDSDHVFCRNLSYDNSVLRGSGADKMFGFSVRCVKD